MTWDQKFMAMADLVASWSKDRSTGVGCVVIRPDHSIVSTGHNGFPRGIDDEVEDRPGGWRRGWRTEHAERNALYTAHERLHGCTMYSTRYPCADCARGIIQSGIVTLVTVEPDWKNDRWPTHWEAAREMLGEAQVLTRFV